MSDIKKDIKVLVKFVQLYCDRKHVYSPRSVVVPHGAAASALKEYAPVLCKDCAGVLLHGVIKRLTCSYDPKPKCKKCETPCYSPVYRQKIKEIMRFSGLATIRKFLGVGLLCDTLFPSPCGRG